MADNQQQVAREEGRVVRAAGVVGCATLISRIFGYLRDAVVAALFGAGLATDAFFVAFRIPNLLRRLFAEGSLTISFIPVFTEYREKRSHEESLILANVSFTLLAVILAAVSAAGMLLAGPIVRLIAPGFVDDPVKLDLTVFLTRFMFPYIFFVSLVALCMGILNSLRHFAVPALSTAVLNISMIVCAFAFRRCFSEPIVALAVGVMAGGLLQLLMQFPVLMRMGVPLKPNFQFNHPGIRQIGCLMVPALFGAAVYQLNIFVGTLLASFLREGSVSYLYYADRLVELPLGIFGIAVGTASLPSLSEQAARGDVEGLKRTVDFSLRLILFVTAPAMVALIILGEPIISVLFQRGEFNFTATTLTNRALLCYTLGLWAFSGIRVVIAAFYAVQDTKTPAKVAALAVATNIAASLIFMFPLGHGGLALATSIASAVNFLMLIHLLRRKIGPLFAPDFMISLGKIVLSSTVLAVFLFAVLALMHWDPTAAFQRRALILAAAVAGGLISYLLAALAFGSAEALMLLRGLRRSLRRR
ncbi:MAG: murein biosynthesis integral membrane protein MurJ [Deltaproteobacteria bacterium]|nr:murein biosynthesis integral membrane protein MurJ [Deltaproteobacteria bacterium]